MVLTEHRSVAQAIGHFQDGARPSVLPRTCSTTKACLFLNSLRRGRLQLGGEAADRGAGQSARLREQCFTPGVGVRGRTVVSDRRRRAVDGPARGQTASGQFNGMPESRWTASGDSGPRP